MSVLLDHSVGLDPRFSCHLAGSEASPGVVEEILRKRGAPSACHILSANRKLDGRELPLGRAPEAIIGMGDGAFVSCILGRPQWVGSGQSGDYAANFAGRIAIVTTRPLSCQS
jgi:hypothetical protein